MREIKFRAWNEVMEKMFTWNDFLNTNMKNTFIAPESTAMILMQYTGLHDKNGKEIYEGDILKLHYIKNGLEKLIASVFYSEDYAQYVIKDTGYVSDDYEPLCDYEDLEVIGNIYENPELLKGADNIE